MFDDVCAQGKYACAVKYSQQYYDADDLICLLRVDRVHSIVVPTQVDKNAR